MFIVPLSGDKIETTTGAEYTALSYTNYQHAPAIYVQASGAEASALSFNDIAKIGGMTVKKLSGGVFEAPSKIAGRAPLPQKDDKVTLGQGAVKVLMLKLNEKGQLADGMLVVGTDMATGQKVTERLSNLVSIERANGDKDFDLKSFRKLYRDYLGAAE